jgi:DNA-binding NtrC family response regulator
MSAFGHILIADDEDYFLTPTAKLLQAEGYSCVCVRSAEEAKSALSADSFDLLIADINMPGNHNMEFLRDTIESQNFLPVIVVTGYPTIDSAVESLRLSVVDYLVKPCEYPNLKEAVQRSIDKGKAVRAVRATRKNLTDWEDQMKSMEQAVLSPQNSGSENNLVGTLDWYLSETAQRFAKLSVSLVSALDALRKARPDKPPDICSLMNCSRLAAFELGLRETVDVLTKTKNSFKSKELGELRKKLELILKSTSGAH